MKRMREAVSMGLWIAVAAWGPAERVLAQGAPVPTNGLVLWLAADDVDGDGVAEGTGEAGLTGTRVDTWVDKAGSAS